MDVLYRYANPKMAALLRYAHEHKHNPDLHCDVLDGKLFQEFKQAFGTKITIAPESHLSICVGDVHDLAWSIVTDGVDFNPGHHSRANTNIPGTFTHHIWHGYSDCTATCSTGYVPGLASMAADFAWFHGPHWHHPGTSY